MLTIDSVPMLKRTRKAYELLVDDLKLQLELKMGENFDPQHIKAEIECCESFIEAIDYNLENNIADHLSLKEFLNRNNQY